jgi:hypothetical protein
LVGHNQIHTDAVFSCKYDVGGLVNPQTDTSDPSNFVDMDLTQAAIDITPCDAKVSALP